MKKIIITLLNLLFIQFALAGPIKTIHFATEATYPPFEFIDETGQMKGFDIDIASAICQQIKAECTFTNQTFDSLIPSLKIGKYDAVISALGITADREKQVDFTQSYYEPSGSFVALKNKHYTLQSLGGKTIGVQTGSTFEKYLHDKYGSTITVKTYASAQDSFLDLASERLDLVMVDTPIAETWLKLDNNIQKYMIVEKPIIDHDYFGSGYGIAVNKNNTELLQALNQGLAEIKKNGTYNKIVKTYFSH